MAAALITIIGFVCVAAAIFFVAAIATNQRRRRDEAWKQVADDRRFDFFASSWTDGPSMTGTVNGFFVSVDTQRVSGQNNNHVTRYTIGYPSSAQTMGLTRQSGALNFTLVKRLMGTTDVEIGDPSFDDRVLIDTTDAIAAARYLSLTRRNAVLHLFAHRQFANPRVTDSAITVDTTGVESSRTNLDSTISALLETALIMSAPTDVDLAGDVVPMPIDQVSDTPTELPPIDAQDDLEPVAAAGSIQDVVRPEPELEPEPDPLSEPEPAAGTPVDLDQRSVASDLFDSGRMGYETTAHFDETYSGARIDWSGEIDMVRELRHDPDFGDHGVKVTVISTTTHRHHAAAEQRRWCTSPMGRESPRVMSSGSRARSSVPTVSPDLCTSPMAQWPCTTRTSADRPTS